MSVGPGSGRLPFFRVCALGSGRLALAAVLSALLLGAPSAGASGSSRGYGAYAGLGTWLDIYAGKAAWRHPAREVAAMAQDGVRTLYLQTGNYRQSVDLIRPRAQGRLIDDAHAAGLRVVAWYLPSFADPAQDERRALAAIRFRSRSGEPFDGFALDIEATTVRPLRLRDRRLLQLSAQLRSAAGHDYPLGAITPSPVGMAPSYWPHIPYRSLTRFYGVILPMAYSTLRRIQGRKATLAYLAATVNAIRTAAGNANVPIHLIGGLSKSMGKNETAGFTRAVTDCAPLGYSLYPFPSTPQATWTALKTSRTHHHARPPCN